MTQQPIESPHRQLKDSVYLQLRADIVDAALAPGAVLREADLASRFGVSKTPLRDALVRLQKDGFVDIPPYRSAVVAGYSRLDLREIYELRELLEGACARQAAHSIDAAGLGALAHVMAASVACVDGGRVVAGGEDRLTALLDEFDQVMYLQSRNKRIDAMVVNIRDHITRIGRLTVAIPGRLAKSVSEHQRIYDAIVQRDGVGAESAMRSHILSVMADQLANVDARAFDVPQSPTRPPALASDSAS